MRKTIAILVIVTVLGIVAAYEVPARTRQAATTVASNSSQQTTSQTTAAAPSASSQSTTTGYKDGTYTGSSQTGVYDTIQVAITISGGKITSVNTPVLIGDSGHSNMINSYAVPQLNQEVITAQSAQIDGVSGASYTTQAYTQSLQSALDQAKA